MIKNKILLILIISLFFLVPQYANAGLSEDCFEVSCDSGYDYYNLDCRPHIETLTDCAPKNAFSCNNGCYTKSSGTKLYCSDPDYAFKTDATGKQICGLVDDGDWVVSGVNVYNANTGNVGIGTTGPVQKLHVQGNSYVSGNMGVGYNSPAAKLDVLGNDYFVGGADPDVFRVRIEEWMGAADIPFMRDYFVIKDTGRVGIGGANPGYKLDVWGDAKISHGSYLATNASSNVGIGTTSPTNKLHVKGGVRVEGLSCLESAGKAVVTDGDGNLTCGNTDDGDWTISGSNVYRSSGNVGIGVTVPKSKLSVGGAGSADEAVYATGVVGMRGEGTGGFLNLNIGVKGTGDWIGVQGISNNITGVHGKGPVAGVHGEGTGSGTGVFGDALDGGKGVHGKSSGYAGYFEGNTYVKNDLGVDGVITGVKRAEFWDGVVVPFGNVGIGTWSPGYKLEVAGRMKINSSDAGIWFESGTTDWFVGRGDANNERLRFYNGGDKFIFTKEGDLKMSGDTLYMWTNEKVLDRDAGILNIAGDFKNSMVSRFHKAVVIDDSGSGTSSDPNYMFTVNVDDNSNGLLVNGYGGSALSCESWSCTALMGATTATTSTGVQGRGTKYDFYADGPGTNYGAASSIRWKEDIEDIPNALSKVNELRGVYFNWNEEHGGQHDMGMIAEEVNEIVPEVVQGDLDNPEYSEGIDYGALTPLLVEAIKDLNKENEGLKERIEALENK